MTPSRAALLSALLVIAAGTVFGYHRAVTVRARADYRSTKAAVKPLHRAYWRSLWRTIKAGAVVVVILAVLLGWAARDARDDAPPSPSSSTSNPTTPPGRRRRPRPTPGGHRGAHQHSFSELLDAFVTALIGSPGGTARCLDALGVCVPVGHQRQRGAAPARTTNGRTADGRHVSASPKGRGITPPQDPR